MKPALLLTVVYEPEPTHTHFFFSPTIACLLVVDSNLLLKPEARLKFWKQGDLFSRTSLHFCAFFSASFEIQSLDRTN